jgi:hypothetical protein
MRLALIGALGFVLLACGGGERGQLLPTGQAAVTGGPTPAAPATAPAPTPAQSACAGVAAPTTLSDAKDVRSVRVVGSAIFFQAGTTVFRVGADGKGLTTVFSSPNLVRSFVDRSALLAIESTDGATTATLRVIKASNADDANATVPDFTQPAPDPTVPDPAAPDPAAPDPAAPPALPGTTVATDFEAAGTTIFESDADSFYLLADTAGGEALVQLNKDAPAPQTVTTVTAVLSHPQLLGTDIWYVQDQQRVFKVGIDDGTPKEIFGIGYASCDLAVNESSAFCSVGTAVERRDLTGGNPATLVDAKSSKTSTRFGALFAHDTTLYVPSDVPDPNVKNVIVALSASATAATPADEKLVACGRGVVTNLAIGDTSVVWSEEDGGLFLAPR